MSSSLESSRFRQLGRAGQLHGAENQRLYASGCPIGGLFLARLLQVAQYQVQLVPAPGKHPEEEDKAVTSRSRKDIVILLPVPHWVT